METGVIKIVAALIRSAAATIDAALLSFCTNAPQFSCNPRLKRACITINHS